MVGRISSFHNYQAVQNDLRRQEAKIVHNQAQLASGKKLLNASDDPLATHYIQNLGQQSEQLRQYMDAIVLTRNRLEHHEVLVANSEEYADQAKRTVMEMINGSHSKEDRLAKTREIQETFSNLLNLANSQDESGNYIFAGTKPKNQPFFRDNENNVTYSGDDYQRKMRISNQLEMALNDPGSKLYMEVDNPFGDYKPSYQLQPASELLLERATNLDSTDDAQYTITFVDMGTGKYGYQLDKDGSAVQTEEFDPRKGIKYEGLSILIRGQITAGDSFTLEPKETVNLFDSFKQVIELSDASVSDASATAELHRLTKEFDAAFIHLGKARTDVGARLNTLDIQTDLHEDFKLTLAKSKSAFEDLDYSQAVIEFNENSLALEASQKAFGKTKDLTLFNYI
ncbi:flagellar hook-associated protein FlgL [Vibrio sp. VB16]|uniref:flagellar hook-associated protein FlgL n=1 Tax=Vibrio sp. VB16 TaxID=2785746 RepID=UPI00189ECE19|nr:flagellar hook-associated protein FlgL [Vibrio sp. VB16]UGA54021.1 flagellar hook-associated protein FlgL [Vibrio sp. VB16]